MYQSVQDGICCCWVFHQTMPFIYQELAYHYRAALSVADVADKRELRQFKETPEQRFALEQEHLQPLPDTDFDTSYFDIRHVSWDSYIEVGGNRYSVPEALCGQPVSIRIPLDDELRIYSNEKLVASHRLCSASSGWQTVPEHHAPLWQQVSQVEHRPLSAYEELL